MKDRIMKILRHPYMAPVVDPFKPLHAAFKPLIGALKSGIAAFKKKRAAKDGFFESLGEAWETTMAETAHKGLGFPQGGKTQVVINGMVIAGAVIGGVIGALYGIPPAAAAASEVGGIVGAMATAAIAGGVTIGALIGIGVGAVGGPFLFASWSKLYNGSIAMGMRGVAACMGGISKARSHARDPRKHALVDRVHKVRLAEQERVTAEDAKMRNLDVMRALAERDTDHRQQMFLEMEEMFAKDFDAVRRKKFDDAASRGLARDITAPAIPEFKKMPFNPGKPQS